MRIQHNIMAMNAYRNYTNNTSAMQKNLERLSSGYKINRAGDDAAGLAISEKMRAQITGLEVASKNAKDGISLVQTAEGALTEVHDMLNRMVELATMSANGTYAGDTDRTQLQKELDQLKDEIDRIADSANFNGIKLLNGDMDAEASSIYGITRMLAAGGTGIDDIGFKTILDTEGSPTSTKTVFSMDFSTLKANKTDSTEEPEGPAGGGSKGTITAAESSFSYLEPADTSIGTSSPDTVQSDSAAADTPAIVQGADLGVTAKKALAALIEGADWFADMDTSAAVEISLIYKETDVAEDQGQGKGTWQLDVGGKTIDVYVEYTEGNKDGVPPTGSVLTIYDKKGGTGLITVTADSGTKNVTEREFENAYKAGAKKLGITYTAPAARVITSGSDKITSTFEGSEALRKALEKAAAEKEPPVTLVDGSIKLGYDSQKDVWEIELVDGGGTTTQIKITAADYDLTSEGVFTLTDEDGNELLKITLNEKASLANLKTAFANTAGNKAIPINYSAAATSDAVTISGNPADITYEATEALIDALGKLADGDAIHVQYDDSGDEPVWKIFSDTDTDGITVSEANAKYDANTGVLTLYDEDGTTELLKITINDASKPNKADLEAGFKTAGDVKTNLVYTKGEDDGTPPPPPEETKPGTATVRIGGKKIDGIELKDGADAADIAKAIFDALSNEETPWDEDPDTEGIQITLTHKNGTDAQYTVTQDGTKLTFTLVDEPTQENVSGNFDWNIEIEGTTFEGTHNAGTYVDTKGVVKESPQFANTVFKITLDDIQDGTVIKVDGKAVTLAIGPESKVKAAAGSTLVKLTENEAKNLDQVLSRVVDGLGSGSARFEFGVNNTGNSHGHAGIAVSSKRYTDDSVDMFTKMGELGKLFEMTVPKDPNSESGLTLQIGDTAEDYNQLKVSIKDCHTASMTYTDEEGNLMSIADISIQNQDDAADAVNVIKEAINYVSDVRGTLGATQNRLDHTINNLSVMTENIQDAESTIRDTDVAEEMMAYTKNNILIQAAQAMLAQANQVPQGVLQLLQ